MAGETTMINSLIVLGGGTSGLVTALILKNTYNNINIKLIKSSSIGIIGVGEGSTEHWAQFMNAVGINVNELVKETDATFKTGIKFTNWNGDNTSYYHSLHDGYLSYNTVQFPYRYASIIAQDRPAIDMIPDHIQNSMHGEPLETTTYQFHFNTFKLNEYLLKKCKEINIEIIDTVINDVILDEAGYVQSLLDENNQQHCADFFVDSSGMKRIISNKLGASWIDCGDYLPMNSAIAFPTERTENIPSYTESTAMSSGWMWRIPTQDRYGNGYVYNDNFLTEEQAIAEAQSVFDHPIEIGKKIKFTAGYVDKFWIKNCVSVGLAGSFVEPLEASSIGTSIQQAFALAAHIFHYEKNNETVANRYNKEFKEVAENIIDFVQLHYITKRNDSEFWKSCQDLKLTDFNKETLDQFKSTLPYPQSFAKPWIMFRDQNWLMVMHGLKMFDANKIKDLLSKQNHSIMYDINTFEKEIKTFFSNLDLVAHREALEIIKNRNGVQVINVQD
jgi:tryptophan halogenase